LIKVHHMIHFQEVKNLLLKVNYKWLNINIKYLGLDDLKLEINLPYSTHTHTYVRCLQHLFCDPFQDRCSSMWACMLSLYFIWEDLTVVSGSSISHTKWVSDKISNCPTSQILYLYKSISGRTISISRREYMETAIQNSHWKFLSIIKSRVFLNRLAWTLKEDNERSFHNIYK